MSGGGEVRRSGWVSQGRLRLWRGCGLALLFVLSACKTQHGPDWVERIEVSGPTLADNDALGLGPESIEERLAQKLTGSGHFKLSDEKTPAPEKSRVLRMALELAFTREAQKEGRAGTYAEVGAALIMKERGDDAAQYEVVGLGEVKVPSEEPEVRRQSLQRALDAALEQLVSSAHLQLAAASKKDSELVKDLASKDTRVKEYATRVLALRKNPAVAGALIEKLSSDDEDEVRKAIGGLIDLKELKAVPTLIELTRGKDPGFLREIVFALGAIGGEDAEAYLYTLEQGHDQPAIRSAAMQALTELRAAAQREPQPKEKP